MTIPYIYVEWRKERITCGLSSIWNPNFQQMLEDRYLWYGEPTIVEFRQYNLPIGETNELLNKIVQRST